jgi:hypothetical protein
MKNDLKVWFHKMLYLIEKKLIFPIANSKVKTILHRLNSSFLTKLFHSSFLVRLDAKNRQHVDWTVYFKAFKSFSTFSYDFES